jgi:hypothetical protein
MLYESKAMDYHQLTTTIGCLCEKVIQLVDDLMSITRSIERLDSYVHDSTSERGL